eukprot:1181721-Prorocentrum_minimum.AAC.3
MTVKTTRSTDTAGMARSRATPAGTETDGQARSLQPTPADIPESVNRPTPARSVFLATPNRQRRLLKKTETAGVGLTPVLPLVMRERFGDQPARAGGPVPRHQIATLT